MKKLPLLAFPSVLHPMLMSFATDTTPASSWIQLARTGSFVSNRYGRFAIEKSDLAQMKWNFDNVTPAAPTELPIDLDHLSNNPQKPLDGLAVGWLKAVELRDDGDTLWGKVSWTEQGASLIREGSYKFVSPSFAKDHVHKNGKKIGTTLLSAALTNHPFLESMAAVTLYNKDVYGALALSADFFPQLSELPLENSMQKPLALSASDGSVVGTLVTFGPNGEELAPELTPEERAASYKIVKVKGQGEDSFVALVAVDGDTPFGWYPASVLAPAPASTDVPSPMPDDTQLAVPPEGVPQGAPAPKLEPPQNFNSGTPAPVVALSADEASLKLHDIALQLMRDQPGRLYGEALKAAFTLRKDYARMVEEIAEVEEPEPVVSLSATLQAADSFVALVHAVKSERGIVSERDALSLAASLRPDLAERYRTDGL